MKEPLPKYTTMATFLCILEVKGYVGPYERGPQPPLPPVGRP